MTASGDRRRAERAAMQAQAAEIGQRFELGGPRITVRRERPRLRHHWGCMTMIGVPILSLIVLTPLLTVFHLPAAFAIPVIAGGIILGGLVYASEGPRRYDHVFAYPGGLVQLIGDEAAPRVIPWGLVDTCVQRFAVPGYGDSDPYVSWLQVTSLDGTQITMSSGYTTSDRDNIGEQADQALGRARLQAAVEQVLSGHPAQFGTVLISHEGIQWRDGRGRDQSAAWRDQATVRLGRNKISLKPPGWKSARDVSLSGVPDSYVALLLVQELGGRVPFRLDGNRMALPGPAPDPSPDLAELLGRPRLLTEHDVCDVLGRPVRVTGGAGHLSFRGQGVTITLVVMGTGRIGQLNVNAGRKRGRPVGGLGMEAWLLSGDRSLTVALPEVTFKVIANGLPEASRAPVLIPLARIVADRITQPEPELR